MSDNWDFWKDYTLGKRFGSLLALYENDLDHNAEDQEAIRQISYISVIYNNFSNADFGSFREDFDTGYAKRKSDYEAEEQNKMEQRRKERDTANPESNSPVLG